MATLCEELSQDKNLGEEVTLIGFSQGGLIGRGFMRMLGFVLFVSLPCFCFVSFYSSALVGVRAFLITEHFKEKCNVPAVKVFISWVSPQMGIFGIPYLNLLPLDEAFDLVVYDKELQDLFSFASYWKGVSGFQLICFQLRKNSIFQFLRVGQIHFA